MGSIAAEIADAPLSTDRKENAMPTKLILLADAESTIAFPMWVTGPTSCKTRTFSVVLPRQKRMVDGEIKDTHGAIRIVRSFVNRPMVKRPRIGAPGFYYAWATTPYNVQMGEDK